MKILADQNISFVADAFADLGEVRLMPGREIRADHLRDCNCLITRAVTAVDEELLSGTAVEFVGTATIGTDHIDLDYLRDSNIGFSNAAGCNAEGASEFVVSGLFALSRRKHFDPFKLKAGIVGCGNVGSRLQQKLEILGIECLVCDPPLRESGSSDHGFVDLDTILRECNFISLHVPLTSCGNHPTYHLLNADRLQRLAPGCLLVNAARGEVVDNLALLKLLRKRKDLLVFLDTWEQEPRVSRELLQRVDLATPHLAGYSVEGRLRGTQMVLDAAGVHFKQSPTWHMSRQFPADRHLLLQPVDSILSAWHGLFRQHFDIWSDHQAFTAGSDLDEISLARHFDELRRAYPSRLEYQRLIVQQQNARLPTTILRKLGFQTAP